MGKLQSIHEHFSPFPCTYTLHKHTLTLTHARVNTHLHVLAPSNLEEDMSVLFSCDSFMSEYFFKEVKQSRSFNEL